MEINIYKIECITNLHVGSGDFNYGVIDNEVERDCLTGNPVIHASGVKGALRDAYESSGKTDAVRIFGSEGDNRTGTKSGAYKFFDAHLLTRPLRVSGNNGLSYISVTTPEIINNFIDTAENFGCNLGLKKIHVDFNKNKVLSNIGGIYVEGDEEENKAGEIDAATKAVLDKLIGGKYALVEKLDKYKLPVVARNKLGENKNLWYEEFVPHHSTFYFMIMCDGECELDFSDPVQFGGNASIGYGYTKITKLEVSTNEQ